MFTALQGSPGNLQQFEEILFNNIDMSASAIVMSLRLATDANGQRVCLVSTFFSFKAALN